SSRALSRARAALVSRFVSRTVRAIGSLFENFGKFSVIYVGERSRMVKDNKTQFYAVFRNISCLPVFQKVLFMTLSRRKPGFESPWGRQKSADFRHFGTVPQPVIA